MDTFFTYLARFNHLVLALILIGAGVAFLASFDWIETRRDENTIAAVPATHGDSPEMVRLRLGEATPLHGSNTLFLPLLSEPQSTLTSRDYARQTMHNLLFVDTTDGTSRWLFPHHRNVIREATRLPPAADYDLGNDEVKPTLALYVEYIRKDRDGNGKLTPADGSSVALSHPDGSRFTDLLTHVDDVLSQRMVSATELSILYRRGTELRVTRASATTHTLIYDREIVALPSEL